MNLKILLAEQNQNKETDYNNINHSNFTSNYFFLLNPSNNKKENNNIFTLKNGLKFYENLRNSKKNINENLHYLKSNEDKKIKNSDNIKTNISKKKTLLNNGKSIFSNCIIDNAFRDTKSCDKNKENFKNNYSPLKQLKKINEIAESEIDSVIYSLYLSHENSNKKVEKKSINQDEEHEGLINNGTSYKNIFISPFSDKINNKEDLLGSFFKIEKNSNKLNKEEKSNRYENFENNFPIRQKNIKFELVRNSSFLRKNIIGNNTTNKSINFKKTISNNEEFKLQSYFYK